MEAAGWPWWTETWRKSKENNEDYDSLATGPYEYCYGKITCFWRSSQLCNCLAFTSLLLLGGGGEGAVLCPLAPRWGTESSDPLLRLLLLWNKSLHSLAAYNSHFISFTIWWVRNSGRIHLGSLGSHLGLGASPVLPVEGWICSLSESSTGPDVQGVSQENIGIGKGTMGYFRT